MRYRGQNRRKNGNSADSQLKKRSLKGHIGTKNIGKYHKSGLFTEKQNGIGSHIARGLRQKTQRKTQETEKRRERRSRGPRGPRGTGRTTAAPSLAETLSNAKKKHTLLINIVDGTFIILVYIKIHLIKIVNLRKH